MKENTQFEPPAVAAAMEIARPVISFAQANELASTHGTPLVVYSRSSIRENYRTLKTAMPKVDLYYAVKANYEPCLLDELQKAGGFVDICSHGELAETIKAGFSTDRMIHTHPCKTQQNIEICHQAGVRWFTFDCLSELDKMLAYSDDFNLLLRLKASGEHSLINLSAKFGCELEKAQELVKATIARGGKIKGLAFHVGSQCTDASDYKVMLSKVRKVWDFCIEMGCPLELIDIGGGFPAPYREAIPSLHDFASEVYEYLEMYFGDTGARYIAEPGRGLAARNATLITKILGKNVRSGETWYFIDEGLYGCFSGKVFDHVDYDIIHPKSKTAALETCIIAGPTCDSSDVVSRHDHLLPDMEIGDLLLVPTMGAYTHSTGAAFFNGLPPAKIVVIE